MCGICEDVSTVINVGILFGGAFVGVGVGVTATCFFEDPSMIRNMAKMINSITAPEIPMMSIFFFLFLPVCSSFFASSREISVDSIAGGATGCGGIVVGGGDDWFWAGSIVSLLWYICENEVKLH